MSEGLIGLLIILAVLIFKSTVKKVAKHVEETVTAEIMEDRVEIYEASNRAYEDLIATCGEDFKTPEELYRMMNKQRKRKADTDNTSK